MAFLDFLERQGDRVLRLGVEHLVLVLAALALGTVIGVALGVVVARRPFLRALVLGTAGFVLTIPSFALFTLLFGVVGRLGTPVVLPGLVLYSLLPIVRNTVTGLLQVDASVVEAAKGPKITIMKYKNKTGYRKRQGHRQPLTRVKVTSIDGI